MILWRLEREEYYFHILDSKKQIAGYFDPDYGLLYPKDKEEEIIDSMWENRDFIAGGHIMVGLAKFGIFDIDYTLNISGLEDKIKSVMLRVSKWKEIISDESIPAHYIGVSHTDQDMLTITFPVKFDKPVRLDAKEIVPKLGSILDMLRQQRLL